MHYADHTQRYNRMYLQTEFWRVTAADHWGEQKVISRIPEVLLFIWLRPVSSSKLVPPSYICQMCRGALLPCPLPTPGLQSSSIIEFMQIPLSRSSIQFSNQIPQKIFDYLDVNNRNYLFSKFLTEKTCCVGPPPSCAHNDMISAGREYRPGAGMRMLQVFLHINNSQLQKPGEGLELPLKWWDLEWTVQESNHPALNKT